MAATMLQQQQEAPSRAQKTRYQQQKHFRGRRRGFALFATYTILAIILFELVLINPHLRPVEAKKKKKIMKKIKEILPLIALLKRKKIVLLPIPM